MYFFIIFLVETEEFILCVHFVFEKYKNIFESKKKEENTETGSQNSKIT